MIDKDSWVKINNSKKDGKPFLALCEGENHPIAIKWVNYKPEDAINIGVEGYWEPLEQAIADLGYEPKPLYYCDYELPDAYLG